MIIPKKSYYFKPEQAEVNWGSPFSEGLRACWLFNEGRGERVMDIVGDHHGYVGGSSNLSAATLENLCTWKPDRYAGMVPVLTQTSAFIKTTLKDDLLRDGQKFSVSFMANFNSGGLGGQTTGRVIERSTAGVSQVAVFARGSNSLGVFMAAITGTAFERTASQGTVLAGQWAHYSVTHDGSNTAANCHIFKNGREVSYGTSVNGLNISDNSAAPIVLLGGLAANRVFDGKISYVQLWDRALSSNEANDLYSHPFQFLKSRKRIMFFPQPSSQNSLTVTPATAVVSVVVPQATAVITSANTKTVTPSAAIISVVLPQATAVITGGALLTVTPAAAPMSVIVNTATAVITQGGSLTVTPAAAPISVVIPQATAVISQGGSLVVTATAAQISVVSPQASAVITGGSILTVTPAASVIQIVVPQPAAVITSGNILTVTTQAAQISIVLPQATATITKPLITTQAGVATITIVVPQASMTTGAQGGVTLTIYAHSAINKFITHPSRIETILNKKSQIETTLNLESSLIND